MSERVPYVQEASSLQQERDEARALALDLLRIVESYVRLDVSAPARVREAAAEARRQVEAWEEKRERS